MTLKDTLKALGRTQGRMDRAQTHALRLAKQRNVLILQAINEGAAYADVELVTGLSTTRLSQVLKRARRTEDAT